MNTGKQRRNTVLQDQLAAPQPNNRMHVMKAPPPAAPASNANKLEQIEEAKYSMYSESPFTQDREKFTFNEWDPEVQ